MFPSTKEFTGIELQHRGKIFLLAFPILSQQTENVKYEIMISYFVIFERFYQFCEKKDIPVL